MTSEFFGASYLALFAPTDQAPASWRNDPEFVANRKKLSPSLGEP